MPMNRPRDIDLKALLLGVAALGAFADTGGPVTAEVDRIAYTALGEACQLPESLVCSVQSQ